MWIVCNVSTIFLSNFYIFLSMVVLSIVAKRILFISWMKAKMNYTNLDNLFNTGIFKYMMLEILLTLVMPYPSLYNKVYYEQANEKSAGIPFLWNDWLLCFCIFFRVHFLLRTILSLSWYTEARAQRVCTIYGCDASYNFALKCMMKQNPWTVLSVMILVTLLMLSYQLRIFERKVTYAFNDITTAMWNMLITMTTIGYGDYAAGSHMGRLIAIIIAFWGVFYVSLFVVALNNILNFDSPEQKAFMLLTRLCAKEQLRTEAAGMLSSAYRLKLYRK